MGLLDIVYVIKTYIVGVWNYWFSLSVDNTHMSVFRLFQQPIFSYSIGGLPIYAFLLMFLTTALLAMITIMEKGAIPGETVPPSVPPSAAPSTVGGRRKKTKKSLS
jgi:hypothetical protein